MSPARALVVLLLALAPVATAQTPEEIKRERDRALDRRARTLERLDAARRSLGVAEAEHKAQAPVVAAIEAEQPGNPLTRWSRDRRLQQARQDLKRIADRVTETQGQISDLSQTEGVQRLQLMRAMQRWIDCLWQMGRDAEERDPPRMEQALRCFAEAQAELEFLDDLGQRELPAPPSPLPPLTEELRRCVKAEDFEQPIEVYRARQKDAVRSAKDLEPIEQEIKDQLQRYERQAEKFMNPRLPELMQRTRARLGQVSELRERIRSQEEALGQRVKELEDERDQRQRAEDAKGAGERVGGEDSR